MSVRIVGISLLYTAVPSLHSLPVSVRDQIDSRREALRIRRRVLREALQAVKDEQQRQSENEKLATAER